MNAELTSASTISEFTAEDKQMVLDAVIPLLVDIVKATGNQNLDVALGELVENAGKGLDASADSDDAVPAKSDEAKVEEVCAPSTAAPAGDKEGLNSTD